MAIPDPGWQLEFRTQVGDPVKYEILKNEGHGLTRTESWQTTSKEQLTFLTTFNDLS
jgi:hypothetical protein